MVSTFVEAGGEPGNKSLESACREVPLRSSEVQDVIVVDSEPNPTEGIE